MQIEDNIPPPRTQAKYPFGIMKVGQSLFFPDEPDGSSSRPAVASRVYAHSKRDGSKFLARKADGGTRIWRIA